MKKEIIAGSVALGLAALTVQSLRCEPLATVPYVDLKKYIGAWFEIAALPAWFESGCTFTSAAYGLAPDGGIIVKNRCIKDNKIKIAEGRAYVADKTSNAKLDVQFQWPFKGKYWIIALGDDYSYAMVGHPNRKYLWILSRRSTLDEQIYNKLVAQAAGQGFDVRKLRKTVQG
jgi:apolipoprotein D and lipocalin family protein